MVVVSLQELISMLYSRFRAAGIPQTTSCISTVHHRKAPVSPTKYTPTHTQTHLKTIYYKYFQRKFPINHFRGNTFAYVLTIHMYNLLLLKYKRKIHFTFTSFNTSSFVFLNFTTLKFMIYIFYF